MCDDKVERIGRVKGSMRKRVWVRPDDIVLISLRPEFSKLSSLIENRKETCDIVHKYFAPTEVNALLPHLKVIDKIITSSEYDQNLFEEENEDDEFNFSFHNNDNTNPTTEETEQHKGEDSLNINLGDLDDI